MVTVARLTAQLDAMARDLEDARQAQTDLTMQLRAVQQEVSTRSSEADAPLSSAERRLQARLKAMAAELEDAQETASGVEIKLRAARQEASDAKDESYKMQKTSEALERIRGAEDAGGSAVMEEVRRLKADLDDERAALEGAKAKLRAAQTQVRKTPSWPRSWANFSLL